MSRGLDGAMAGLVVLASAVQTILRMRTRCACALLWICAPVAGAHAQQSVSLADARAAALTRGAAVVLAALDTASARARVTDARTIANPTINGLYTDNAPREHVDIAIPLDFVFLRTLRVRAAERDVDAARVRLIFEQAAASYRVTELYARAVGAVARAQLTRQSAVDADSLLSLSAIRERAGDGSALDVELARINRGQFRVRAAQDSLMAITAILDVQRTMALPSDRVSITLTDSLSALAPRVDNVSVGFAPGADSMPAGSPLLVVAAARNVDARAATLAAERRRVYGIPTMSVGVEAGLPGTPGLLPTVGLSFPIPLPSGNRGAVAIASTARDRAVAELAIAKRESAAATASAVRARDVAASRVRETRDLVSSAERVAALSLVAYREGEVSLAFVLDAGRRARDLRDDYITALADLVAFDAAVALYSTTMSNQ